MYMCLLNKSNTHVQWIPSAETSEWSLYTGGLPSQVYFANNFKCSHLNSGEVSRQVAIYMCTKVSHLCILLQSILQQLDNKCI